MSILETKNLSITFGGHTAVDNVTFSVPDKEFKSIIGPNGAGKTTLFNLLSGQLKPSSGDVYLKGKKITRLSTTKRARLGIGRSFQMTNVFPNLTVLENVRLAVQSRKGIRYVMHRNINAFSDIMSESHELLKLVMLTNKADSLAVNLAHGEKRKLEIAMLLALDPEILLLDEPTAGMSLEEVPQILEVIRAIKSQGTKTIVLIEHKMDLIMDLSDSIMVLFNGRLLADDHPKEIMKNEQVQSAYLGGLYDEHSA
ncbi:ABC transporter ATP-binding protein [Bacillus sp. es.034]|uniref:ABC transporter ATP-binding protein n=1 Tax=Bacillus sp. es.034 TaxID=1761763 RepID=UPI000BF44DA5|nr:ABC transporter ATP-binding protein [Bacillus sp. es.034]PFG07111.1 branched-chain amino acid transport system ATP-binding protein [Bacillus sp. es.034]